MKKEDEVVDLLGDSYFNPRISMHEGIKNLLKDSDVNPLISKHYEMQTKALTIYKYRHLQAVRDEIVSLCEQDIMLYEKHRKIFDNIPCLAYYRLVNLFCGENNFDKALYYCNLAIANNQLYPTDDYFIEKKEIH